MLDALWPIAYFLLAAAVHASVDARRCGTATTVAIVRHGRARMIVLGAALFAAPAVVVLDESARVDRASPSPLITGVAAVAVAWRIARLVDESNHARVVLGESEARFRALVQHAADIIIVVYRRRARCTT